MTLCFVLLFDNGENAIVVSDGLEISPFNFLKTLTSVKINQTSVKGSEVLIASAGRTADINIIFEAFNNPDFKFAYEIEKSLFFIKEDTNVLFIDNIEYQSLDPDVRLYSIYNRFLKDKQERLSKLKSDMETSELLRDNPIFLIVFTKERRVNFSIVNDADGLYKIFEQSYASIGIWETFEVLIRKEGWNIKNNYEEAMKMANKILDFYEEYIPLVGGKRHIEILIPPE